MESKCGKCELDIANVKDGFKCAECSVSYHVLCSSEASKKCGTRNKSTWKCDACIAENSSSSSRVGEDRDGGQTAVLRALAAFRHEVNEKWTSRLEKMQEDLHTVTEDIGQLRRQLEMTIEDAKKTTAKVVELEGENARLNSVVSQLRSEVDDLQQHTRKNNIIITGVLFSKHENLSVVLDGIAKLIKIEFHWYDVSAAHRLQQRDKDGNPPAIVVNFVSRKVKTEWMLARKSTKSLSAKDLNDRFPDVTIYFNEHLTAQNQTIFKKGRELVKQSKLAFVWVNDGRILAKKTSMGRTSRVRSLEDLQRLVNVSAPPPTPPAASNFSVSTASTAP